MERVLNQLVERLRKTYEDRLVSVVLYGSGDLAKFLDGHADLFTLGELAIMLWLVIMGAKERQPLAAAAA